MMMHSELEILIGTENETRQNKSHYEPIYHVMNEP